MLVMIKMDEMIKGDQLVIDIMKSWFMQEPTRIEPLNGQSPNYGWKVSYGNKIYVLRQCVRNNELPWLQYLEVLTNELIQRGYPIQRIIASLSGKQTIQKYGHFWQLRQFVEGRLHQMGCDTDEQEVIRNMIQLHSMKKLPQGPKNPNCQLYNWIYQSERCLKETEDALMYCTNNKRRQQLLTVYEKELQIALETLTPEIYEQLPVSLTHGDFHANNLLYNETNLIMVLDFDTVDFRPRVYDVAVATYLLTRIKRGSFELDMKRTVKFIKNYSLQCKLSEQEIRSMTPLIQLLYLPTARYLNMLRKESPHLLDWYLDWSLDALVSARKQLKVDWFL